MDKKPHIASPTSSHANIHVIFMPAELTDDSVQESTPCTLLNQSESNEHTYLEPTNVPDDVELSTVDSSSHSNLPPSMQSHYTSTSMYCLCVTTYVCMIAFV